MDNRYQWTLKAATMAALLFAGLILAGCEKSDQELVQSAIENQKKGELRTSIIELKDALQKNAANKEARHLLGSIYADAGEGAAAEKELRKANELGVGDDVTAVAMGKALLTQGRYDDVVALVSQTKNVAAADKILLTSQLGDAYVGLGKYPQAAKVFASALKAKPGFVPALMGQARLLGAQNDLDGAKKKIGAVLAADNSHVDGWILKGEIATLQGDATLASKAYEQALKFDAQRPLNFQNFHIRSQLANVLLARKDVVAANKHIEELLKLAPDHPLPKYLHGLAAYLEGDLETAGDEIQVVLSRNPDHRPSQFLLGAVAYDQGRLEQAEMYLSTFVSAVPAHVPGRKLLGATRLRLEQPESAVEALAPALEHSPEDLQLVSMVGNAAFGGRDRNAGARHLEKVAAKSSDSAAMRQGLASVYLSAGDTDKAISTLESSINRHGQEYQTRSLLVLGHLRKNDLPKAQSLAQQLVKDYPSNAHAWTLLGSVFTQVREMGKAKQAFTKAIGEQADFIPALLSLAQLEYAQGNAQAAIAAFEKTLAAAPGNVPVMMALAQISGEAGDSAQMVSWLQKATQSDARALQPRITLARYHLTRGELQQAGKLIDEAAGINADDASVLLTRGLAAAAGGDVDAAAKQFRRMTEVHPQRPEGYHHLAQIEIQRNKPGAARELLGQALKVQPKHLAAAVILAQLEINTGAHQAAREVIASVREQHPELAAGDALEGDLHMNAGAFKKAAAAYKNGIQKQQSSELLMKLHAAQSRTGDKVSGLKLFEKWLESNPRDVRLRTLLAAGYQEQGQADKALRHYLSVLEVQQNSPGVLNNLAWIYLDKNDKRALDYAERAHKAAPSSPAITDTLGWVLLQQGDGKRGLELLRKAAIASPDTAEIRYHLAVGLAKNGDKAGAAAELGTLLGSGAEFPARAEAEALLKTLR